MMENKLDKEIREKLKGREIIPSASAWERLSDQLDIHQKKKRRAWVMYIGYAASLALIVSLFLLTNKKGKEVNNPEKLIVQEEMKNSEPDVFTVPKVESLHKETNVHETEVAINKPISQPKKNVQKAPSKTKKNSNTESVNFDFVDKKLEELKKQDNTKIAITEEVIDSTRLKPILEKSNSTIKVDPNALLFAVTHTREELRKFYKKYCIDRKDVLLTIQEELKKSRLKIDPNTILAEVEKDVDEESFQNNFYQFIKKRVSDVATAIANRNN